MWKIEQQSETGPDDDYYLVWWEITNGQTVFKCDNEEDAKWLASVLNNY